ncbi:MAG: Y4yA family PLP-dependent enzyme [Acidipropionibacterium acidipropionici]|uniref:Y4yA family PLP-dependent enzyme n=1 Tax=Acidipropionibacterium acidipropionici TaxID=1748 RepID=UPI002F358679
MTEEPTLREACQGTPPLSARLEPWMQELLADPATCSSLLERYGSPLNVHDFSALPRNAAELTEVAEGSGVDLRIFVARKANKTLGMVRAAHRAGLGVDVGSERELGQVLEAGVSPHDVVVTAAIKPDPVLRLALESRSLLVLDNLDEVAASRRVAEQVTGARSAEPGRPADGASGAPEPFPVALRLAPKPSDLIPPTRFGESARAWLELIDSGGLGDLLRVDGVHFHLHGYDPTARATALGEALELIDALRERGLAQDGAFVDIGGGIPMSYLDDAEQWDAFWQAHERQAPESGLGGGARAADDDRPAAAPDAGEDAPTAPLTWRREPLRQVYPYHQQVIRGPWLERFLGHEIRPGATAGQALRERGVQLRCEPGRSMMDGCGMTLARVIQRTSASDGVPLVGLEMNRTQCRSTSDDFLVDPILVRTGTRGDATDPSVAGAGQSRASERFEGFLVGAYCIEAELILRRRLAFPQGVAVGDVIALPNTAGYLMHILESASHQIPLASNVERVGGGEAGGSGGDHPSAEVADRSRTGGTDHSSTAVEGSDPRPDVPGFKRDGIDRVLPIRA